MKKLLCLVILSACVASAFAIDEIVALSNGERIFVKNDGTWTFLYEPSVQLTQQSNGIFTFRRTHWGMSREVVKISEQSVFSYDSPEIVIYPREIFGLSCNLAYTFYEDRLTRAAYVFTQKYADPMRHFTDFLTLDRELKDKYGQPTSQGQNWTDTTYKSRTADWGKALQRGDLSFQTKFETDSTSIVLSLGGGPSEIRLAIVYSGKVLAALRDEQVRKESVKDL